MGYVIAVAIVVCALIFVSIVSMFEQVRALKIRVSMLEEQVAMRTVHVSAMGGGVGVGTKDVVVALERAVAAHDGSGVNR